MEEKEKRFPAETNKMTNFLYIRIFLYQAYRPGQRANFIFDSSLIASDFIFFNRMGKEKQFHSEK